jgi:predicted aspartyl protease
MSWTFPPTSDLIRVTTRLWRGSSGIIAGLAVDTGATMTVVHPDLLKILGYDLLQPAGQTAVTTGSGQERVHQYVLDRVQTLGHEVQDLRVNSYPLPAALGVEGLLGLDFFRGPHRLVIDFHRGTVAVEPSA